MGTVLISERSGRASEREPLFCNSQALLVFLILCSMSRGFRIQVEVSSRVCVNEVKIIDGRMMVFDQFMANVQFAINRTVACL